MKAEDLTDEWIMGQTQAPMVLSGHRRLAETAFKAGMKEVVEWIDANSKDALIRDSSPQMFMTGFAKWEWQAKLEEWGEGEAKRMNWNGELRSK